MEINKKMKQANVVLSPLSNGKSFIINSHIGHNIITFDRGFNVICC